MICDRGFLPQDYPEEYLLYRSLHPRNIADSEICQVIIGIGAALAGAGTTVASVIGSAAGALFSGAVASGTPLIGQHQDDTFKKSADLGAILSSIVVGAMEGFTSANNLLMEGQNYDNTGDLRSYFAGGTFVDFPGVDKNAVTNAMNTFLIGNSINNLWKDQKVFILGGRHFSESFFLSFLLVPEL